MSLTLHLGDLRRGFLQEARADLGALSAGAARLGDAPDPAALGALGVVAHRLRGSAGLYGCPRLARLAGLLERVLEARPTADGGGYAALLSLLLGVLDTGLTALEGGAPEPDLAALLNRAGGAEALGRVLRAQPLAFAPRGPGLADPRPDPLSTDPLSPETRPPGGGALENELRAFVREQAEVWAYFAPEVRDHLAALRAALEAEAPDLALGFRAAHTIKGSALMVGLEPLGHFAHHLEDVLGAVQGGGLALDGPLRGALRRGTDAVDDLLAVAEGAPGPAGGLEARLQTLGAWFTALAAGELPGDPAAPAATPSPAGAVSAGSAAPGPSPAGATLRLPAQTLEALQDALGDLVATRDRLGGALAQLGALEDAMQEGQRRFQQAVRDFEHKHLDPDMLRAAGAAPTLPGLRDAFGELELDAYSDLNVLARSVTELSADFGELRRRLSGALDEARTEHDALGKALREARADLGHAARLPFSQLSGRLRRWGREHAARLQLVTGGEDVPVDAAALQALADALLHLLSNALHHGLEAPHERAALGKPALGQVQLRAEQHGEFLDVHVQDDGRGLDLARIRERALARGLRSAAELQAMGDDEAARLILLPGLSTADALSTAAGRGVGMDVVASAVRRLGGELLIRTVPGEGTAFTLRVPTSRRVLDLLPVEVGPHTLAFALGSVRTLLEVPASSLAQGPAGPSLVHEGRAVPLVDLRALWGTRAHGAAPGERGRADSARVVLLHTLSGEVAARVDDFGTLQERAVAAPSALLGGLDYLAGCALGAGGEVLPLLDAQGLLRLWRRPGAWLRAAQAPRARGRVLLVDDSLSVRRSVSRMLARAGYEVDTASDGQEALEALGRAAPYGAVISDLEMPRLNGFELLSALRGRAQTAELPVMMMTTRSGEKHQRLAFSLGATDYFTKPVNEGLLLRQLASALGPPSGGDAP